MEDKNVVIPATDESGSSTLENTNKETKTFTQDEVDSILKERLKKENETLLKKLGFEDKTKINIDEVSKKFERLDALEKEVLILQQEKQKNNETKELQKLGFDNEFIEYALTKIEKGEKFIENAKAFLEKNPKLARENYQKINSSLDLNGQGVKPLDQMTTKEYVKYREKNPL